MHTSRDPSLTGALTLPASYQWVMLALVWLLYASFGMVTQSLAPLVTPISQDLGLSYTQLGVILGAWPLVYIGVAFAAGTTIDRIGLRKSLGIGILFVDLSVVLRGLATGFETMFLFVAIFGIGGPMISIGAPKVISVWFEGKSRATAVGIYTTGPQIGGVVALSTANSLLLPLTGSWRLAFAAYGLVVFTAAIFWWLLSREAPRHADHLQERSIVNGGAFARLMRVRNVWLVLVIAFVSFVSSHAVSDWLPKILQAGGMSPAEAGFWASAPSLIGIAGALTIPRLVPTRQKRRVLAILLVGYSLATLVLGATSGPPVIGALFLQGIGRSSINPLLMLILMDTPEVGPRHMGAAAGLYFTIGEMGGFAGPFVLGWLADLTGGFFAGLALLALMNVIALAFIFFLTESHAEHA